MDIENLPFIPTNINKENNLLEPNSSIKNNLDKTKLISPNAVSDGPDDGSLDYFASSFGWVHRHLTFQKATSRLAVSWPDNDKYFNIVGHGSDGYIETGIGQSGTPNANSNYLSVSNILKWKSDLAKISQHPVPALRLFGCHVGTGPIGADYLFEVAKIIQKKAMGFTGFIYTDVYNTYEKGAVWQIATPQNKPSPINASSPHFHNDYNTNSIVIVDSGKIISVKLNDFIKIEFQSKKMTNDTVTIRSINSDLLNSAALSLFATNPYKIPGKPLATISANVNITVNINNHLVIIRYKIYNNRLIVSENGKYGHYTRNNVVDFY